IRRWRYNLTPAESKFKTPMLDHQDKYMMKAQVHVSKSSAISDEQPLPRKKIIVNMLKHIFRGRLLASFQDHEHEGGVTRSQGGIKDIVLKIKIQDHSMQKKFPRTRLQVSRKSKLSGPRSLLLKILRDNLTASVISNQWERFAELELIRFAFRVMPVESFSCGLGTFFKMVLYFYKTLAGSF
nr:hypothetical protein [Tanacetum cinerariifolium]